jgi:hypothetical protein
MKALTLCGLAAAATCFAFGGQAQPSYPTSGYDYYGPGNPQDQYPQDQYQQPYSGQYNTYPNTDAYQNYNQSYQDYNQAMSAYNAARDSAAQQRYDYENNEAQYRENQRVYRRRLHEYDEARDAYDAEYGPGAYERYYGPPPLPPYPD